MESIPMKQPPQPWDHADPFMNREKWRFTVWASFVLTMGYGIYEGDWILILVSLCIGFLGFATARARRKLSQQEPEPKIEPWNKY